MLHPERRAALFQSILESMGESVLVVDTEGREIYANAELRRFQGKAAPGQNGDAWRKPGPMQIFDSKGHELPFEDWPLERALRGDFRSNIEIWVRGMAHRPGQTLLSISTWSLVDGNGDIQGAVAVSRDITDVRAIEDRLRQAQRLETIGQLAGGIAHDVNNSLAAALLGIDTLKRGGADPAAALATIEAAARHGADLARRLLAFARKQPLLPETTEMDALAEDMLLLLRPTLPAGIAVSKECAEQLYADVDASELTAALLNLCVNARDAMGEAGGEIRLRIEQIASPHFRSGIEASLPAGDYVRLTVEDDGPGMSEDTMRKAIDPYFTTKAEQGGTGLGLSTVYGFIRQSGGAMNIANADDGGLRVELLLPASATPDSGADVEVRESKTIRTVLVVDDNFFVRDSTQLLLETHGFESFTAASAADALALIDERPVDLLLTDVMMPGGMNGVELAAEAARRRPDLSIIVSTGFTDTPIDAKKIGGRGCAVLRKPFTAEAMMQAIAAVS